MACARAGTNVFSRELQIVIMTAAMRIKLELRLSEQSASAYIASDGDRAASA